ncbi:hypothetical protein [Citrobacter sp. FP75]|uniref:hypothetical protein n=1 Tax=Citrobacter sp. FP75 TaxID=1852949 RepID=UPI001BC9FBC3|nr:hypothetical protein [Citrobacter sp. FP75]
MPWQGVPFKFLEAGNVEQLFLSLHSLPKLTIDSPTDYSQLWLTVGATFLGGIIPALIAWRTFYINSKNTKKEQQEQRRFLQAERAKQHIFMMGERSSQFASLKEERELQSKIAEKTINAQVISANRQNWIIDLRKSIADFCAAFFVLYDARSDFLIHSDIHSKAMESYSKSRSNPSSKEWLDRASVDFNIHLEVSRKARNSVDSIMYNVLLMINTSEPDGAAIKILMNNLNLCALTLKTNEEGVVANFQENYVEALKHSNELIEASKRLLKNEWTRVKSGD